MKPGAMLMIVKTKLGLKMTRLAVVENCPSNQTLACLLLLWWPRRVTRSRVNPRSFCRAAFTLTARPSHLPRGFCIYRAAFLMRLQVTLLGHHKTLPDPFSSRALILKAITPLRENRVWLRETTVKYGPATE